MQTRVFLFLLRHWGCTRTSPHALLMLQKMRSSYLLARKHPLSEGRVHECHWQYGWGGCHRWLGAASTRSPWLGRRSLHAFLHAQAACLPFLPATELANSSDMQTVFTSLVCLFVQLKPSLSFQLGSYQALSPTPPLVKQPQLSQADPSASRAACH